MRLQPPHQPVSARRSDRTGLLPGPPDSAEGNTELPAAVLRLQALAGRVLPRMYDPARRLFLFTQRRSGAGVVNDGISVRYSAIALLGLQALQTDLPPFTGAERARIADELLSRSAGAGLGDTALIAWATSANTAACAPLWKQLADFRPGAAGHATVEVAWALAALTACRPPGFEGLEAEIARRLAASCAQGSGLFPHVIGKSGLRSHVTCFADQVYPIHALSLHARLRADPHALGVASRAARRICELQGPDGQWWWHYDVRTGGVIEGYPVYAIHQDAMAPLALRALEAAGGPQLQSHVERGLAWLVRAPELNGGSLIDMDAEMVWRKVGRREPGKTSRYLQAAVSRVAGRRASFVDTLFPPGTIDYEDRPYHWGWLLKAWSNPDGHASHPGVDGLR